MRLSPNATAADVVAFLDAINYPCAWDQDILARHCLLTRIETPCGDVAGFYWLHGLKGAPGVLDFHVAIHPDFQGRLTRKLLAAFLVHVRSTGARTLLARPISGAHADLLLRLGFSLHGPFAVLPLNPLPVSVPASIQRAVLRLERTPRG